MFKALSRSARTIRALRAEVARLSAELEIERARHADLLAAQDRT